MCTLYSRHDLRHEDISINIGSCFPGTHTSDFYNSGFISFRMDWLISLKSRGLSGVFSITATLLTGMETVTFTKLPISQTWALYVSAPADLILLLALKTEGGPMECRQPPESWRDQETDCPQSFQEEPDLLRPRLWCPCQMSDPRIVR